MSSVTVIVTSMLCVRSFAAGMVAVAASADVLLASSALPATISHR